MHMTDDDATLGSADSDPANSGHLPHRGFPESIFPDVIVTVSTAHPFDVVTAWPHCPSTQGISAHWRPFLASGSGILPKFGSSVPRNHYGDEMRAPLADHLRGVELWRIKVGEGLVIWTAKAIRR